MSKPPAETTHSIEVAAGVRLHAVERGRGAPVVFIHGGGKDFRYWRAQMEPFARDHRVIAYSRRYAAPNQNREIVPDYSARVDARDLAVLMETLGAGPAHLVGASIGGVAALFLAVERPELVRSLVLAEPPVLRWAQHTPDGAALFDAFSTRAFRPAGEAFRAGDPEHAMRLLMDAFLGAGAFDRFPEGVRGRVMSGARDWEAQTTSSASFPDLPRDAVRRLEQPVLMLSGERTIPIHAIVDDELERLLPSVRRVVVPAATHDVWADQPELCRAEVVRFLAGGA